MINTKFFCRLCTLLHEPRSINPGHHYEDFNEWWRGKGTCINGNWNKFYAALNKDRELGTVRKSINIPKVNSSTAEHEKLDTNIDSDKETNVVEEVNGKQKPQQGKEDDKSLDFEDVKP